MAAKEFVYQDPYPLGKDTTSYRKIEGSEKYVTVDRVRRQGCHQGLPRGARRPGQRGHAGRLVPAASRAQRAGGQDPERSRGLPERQGGRPGVPAQRRDRRPVRASGLPGHRHRHDRRQERPAGLDRRQGRGVALQGDLQDLHRREPALLPDRGRWTCTRRSTPAPTSRPRSTSWPPTATTTSSSSSPRGAARPTRPCCTRRPRPCSPRQAWRNSWWRR